MKRPKRASAQDQILKNGRSYLGVQYMGDHFSQSLFFANQFVSKGVQLLSMLGVDECLLPEDFDQQQMSDDQSEGSQWEAVQYQLRHPIKPIPLSMRSLIIQDYQFAIGLSLQFGSEIGQSREGVERSVHWQIRREEAVVDCFSVALQQGKEPVILQQAIRHPKLSQPCQICLDAIGRVNTMWEAEGIQISSAFMKTDRSELVIRLNQSIFLYDLLFTERDELLLKLQAAIVRHLMSNQIGHHLQAVETSSVLTDLKDISLDDKIVLAYQLKQLGLTLIFSNKLILTKATAPAYHRCIFHLAQLCTIHQQYEQQALAIVESQQDGVQDAFSRLYQSTISKESDI